MGSPGRGHTSPAAPTSATATRTAAPQGMGSAGYAANNTKMYWRMYSGHNCTNYAAYRMVQSGLPNQRPWSGGGNATYWGTSMPRITDDVPAVGAVAWWKANTGPAGSAGPRRLRREGRLQRRDHRLPGQLGRRLLLGRDHPVQRQLAERLRALQRRRPVQHQAHRSSPASPRSAPADHDPRHAGRRPMRRSPISGTPTALRSRRRPQRASSSVAAAPARPSPSGPPPPSSATAARPWPPRRPPSSKPASCRTPPRP